MGGLTYQDFVNAINYANTLNPHVVSMSLHVSGQVNPTGPPPWAPNVVYVGSSGDGGYNNDTSRSFMSNPWPREDPNVLAVGGTALYLATPLGTPTPAGLPPGFPLYFTERAWSCPPSTGGCSGGGLATATLYPLPAYQATVVPTALATAIATLTPGARGRLVPDVALLAASDTGPLIFVNGSMSPIASGGTSAAAPLWAGLLALAVPTTGASTQQVATTLYTLAASPTAYAANFNDILYGTNGNCQNPPAPPVVCQAGPGYDLVTGLGSPKANALVPTLAAMLGATLLPTATNTPSATPTDLPATATIRALTATPTDLPATATVRALTATPTDLPATATIRALTATPTDLPATATVRALTATPTDLPATATIRALTATPTDLPATATIRALTATPTDLPATATVRALTRTATPTLSLPALPPSGTLGAPCTTVVGGTCTVSGGVTGTWTRTSSGVFTVTGTAPAGGLAGVPAIQLATTANRGGETFFNACSAVTGPGSTTTCAGTTTGDILQGAIIVITYPNAFVGGLTSTGIATGANTANNLTPAQAQTQAQGTAGFLTGTGGAPCVVVVGQSCTVAGALSGSLLRTGSTRFTLTGAVPAGLIARLTPVAVFSTDGGIQAVACAAPTAGTGGTTLTCTGTIAGNALQGSTVALCFTAATPCLLGTVSGQALAAPPPLLLPLPFLPPPSATPAASTALAAAAAAAAGRPAGAGRGARGGRAGDPGGG